MQRSLAGLPPSEVTKTSAGHPAGGLAQAGTPSRSRDAWGSADTPGQPLERLRESIIEDPAVARPTRLCRGRRLRGNSLRFTLQARGCPRSVWSQGPSLAPRVRIQSPYSFLKAGCESEFHERSGCAMGTFYGKCKIENPVERARSAVLQRLLVGTGSEFTWVPGRTLERIGIRREKKAASFIRANGEQITRSVGFAIIRLDKYFTIDEIVFAESGDLMPLGARTLEGLNLTIDSARRRLVAAGPPPAASPASPRLTSALHLRRKKPHSGERAH